MVPSPIQLREKYTAFLQPNRILLTGHSHQAWPDCAREGVIDAYSDAVLHVDDKWDRAWEKARVLREAVGQTLGVHADEIALAQNSHELAVRFLSGLDWSKRRQIVTTDGEFHGIRRQLDRLEETGVEIIRVPVKPLDSLAQRLGDAVSIKTAALMVSTVLFQTASIVPDLAQAIALAHRYETPIYLDAYHGFRALPMPLDTLGDDPIYISAGGYKYAQWGEGCCWLRIPPNSKMRPVYTGWFAEFAHLDRAPSQGVGYGEHGVDRFAGSTYDPTSHYRAARVVQFFRDHQLTDSALRACSLSQTQRIIDGVEHLELLTPRRADLRAGFVAVRVPHASQVVKQLRDRGIYVDSRGDILRLGPAPYTTNDEIDTACEALRELTV